MELIGYDQITAGSLKVSREKKVGVWDDQLARGRIKGIEIEADGISVRRPPEKTPGVPQGPTVTG